MVGVSGKKGGRTGGDATEKSHNVEFAKGGKGGENTMFPPQSADPAEKGETRDTTRTDDNPHPGMTADHGAKGGSTKMFGYAASQPATAGITGAR
jgi:hypothetical protein